MALRWRSGQWRGPIYLALGMVLGISGVAVWLRPTAQAESPTLQGPRYDDCVVDCADNGGLSLFDRSRGVCECAGRP